MGWLGGRLPQRAGSLGLNGGGAAAAVPPSTCWYHNTCLDLCWRQTDGQTAASLKARSSTLAGFNEKPGEPKLDDIQFQLVCLRRGFTLLPLGTLLLGDVTSSLLVIQLLLFTELRRDRFQSPTLIGHLWSNTINTHTVYYIHSVSYPTQVHTLVFIIIQTARSENLTLTVCIAGVNRSI